MDDRTAKGGHVLLRRVKGGGLAAGAPKGGGRAPVEVMIPAARGSGRERTGGMGAGAARSPGDPTVSAGMGARDSALRSGSRRRRLKRYIFQRLAVVVALLILFYATSLHGLGMRTLVLAGLLVLALYWLFRDTL